MRQDGRTCDEFPKCQMGRHVIDATRHKRQHHQRMTTHADFHPEADGVTHALVLTPTERWGFMRSLPKMPRYHQGEHGEQLATGIEAAVERDLSKRKRSRILDSSDVVDTSMSYGPPWSVK